MRDKAIHILDRILESKKSHAVFLVGSLVRWVPIDDPKMGDLMTNNKAKLVGIYDRRAKSPDIAADLVDVLYGGPS